MNERREIDRRRFVRCLTSGILGTAAASGVDWSADAQIQAPTNVKVITGSSKSLITLADLRWQGMYRWAGAGNAYAAGDGGVDRAYVGVAVRYVGGQRRILLPWYRAAGFDPNGIANYNINVGALVEYSLPAASPSTTSRVLDAPAMVPTGRRWSNWYVYDPTLPGPVSNGYHMSAIWWDEENQGIWYKVYPYYAQFNYPSIGFTRLHDDGSCTKYGMWFYGANTTPGDAGGSAWKRITGSFCPIPSSARVGNLTGKTMGISGAYTSVTGEQHKGPGFAAFSGMFNPYTTPPSTPWPKGLDLMDFSYASPMANPAHPLDLSGYSPHGCGRNTPYSIPEATHASVPGPLNGTYRWQGGDQAKTFCWVETATKQGILCFGVQEAGTIWYGTNPCAFNAAGQKYQTWDGANTNLLYPLPAGYIAHEDLVSQRQQTYGFLSTNWKSALWIFDPEHLKEVALRTRSPYSDGGGYNSLPSMGPASTYEWHPRWPNIPAGVYMATGQRVQDTPYVHGGELATGVWDEAAQELLWFKARSCWPIGGADYGGAEGYPSLQIFTVS